MDLNLDLKKIEDFCVTNSVSFLGVFGSYARGEANTSSDLDLLIEYTDKKNMFDHVRLQREFSALTNKQVDLVTKRSLSPYIKDYVLEDLKVLYEQK